MLRELPYALQKAVKYPYKIARDVQANTVEALFLSAELTRSFSEASGVQVGLAIWLTSNCVAIHL